MTSAKSPADQAPPPTGVSAGSHPRNPQGSRFPWWAPILGGTVVILLVVIVTSLGVLGAFGGLGANRSGSTNRLPVVDDRTAFEITVPRGTSITGFYSGTRRDCPIVEVDFSDHGLRAYAIARTCDDPGRGAIGNGNHGSYRTIADVSAPRTVQRVQSRLGPADVFSQAYYECTNACRNFTEPVAIVMLQQPVNPDFPTLVLISLKGELERPQFTRIVRDLAAPSQ